MTRAEIAAARDRLDLDMVVTVARNYMPRALDALDRVFAYRDELAKNGHHLIVADLDRALEGVPV